MRYLALVSLFLSLNSLSFGQTDVLNGQNWLTAFFSSNNEFSSTVDVPVAGMPFTTARQITVSSVPPFIFNVSIGSASATAINKGDAVVISFYCRRNDGISDAGYLELKFEQTGDGSRTSIQLPANAVDTRWRRFDVPVIAVEDYPTGGAFFSFQMGAMAQILEIGGVEITNYGNRSAYPGETIDAFSAGSVGGIGSGLSFTDTTTLGISKVWRMTTDELPADFERYWEVFLNSSVPTPVNEGDQLVAIFYARNSDGDGEGVFDMVVERNSSPFTKSADGFVSADDGWRQFIIPFKAAETYAANELSYSFRFGADIGMIDIGGIELLNFGTDLGNTQLTGRYDYDGRRSDAAWRTAARQRIEQIRKGDLTVKQFDSTGTLIPDNAVSVEMTEHEFGFGSAVNTQWILNEQGSDGQIYRNVVQENFNKLVHENGMKWDNWETNPQDALNLLQWGLDHGIPEFRGHVLIWPGFPSYTEVPADVYNLTGQPLRDRFLNHIIDQAGNVNVNGYFRDWDVLNEPTDEREFIDIIGDDAVMTDWFNQAAATDPAARRFLNENAVATHGGLWDPIHDYYDFAIPLILNNGGAMDGFGFQSHFNLGATAPEKVLEIFDRYAAYGSGDGLELQITEYDHRTQDPILQGDLIYDYMLASFSHPNMTTFMLWGFWDGSSFVDNGPLYDLDWNLKDSGHMWQQLVFDEWWTDESGTSDSEGSFELRGFKGDYKITATNGPITKIFHQSLPGDGVEVNLQLDGSPGTHHVWIFEAEDALLNQPMIQQSDSDAIGGTYVKVEDGNESIGSPSTDGVLRYYFDLENASTVAFWGRVYLEDGDTQDDSLWFRVNGGTWYLWNNIETGTYWHWDQVHDSNNAESPLNLNLPAGSNQIEITYREDGLRLDQLLVTTDTAFVPDNAIAQPTGLVASNPTTEQIQLNWVDHTNSETEYRIERKEGAAGTWAEVGSVGINETQFIDTGLNSGTEYFYRTRASNATKQSLYSDEASATTIALYTTWLNDNFTPAEQADLLISGPDADPDKDGITNLVEYGTGTNPNLSDSPAPTTIEPNSGDYSIVFNRITPHDILYSVVVSTDLDEWDEIARLEPNSETWTGSATVEETPNGEFIKVTITDTSLPNATTFVKFLRCEITTN